MAFYGALERILAELNEYELITAEGLTYRPTITIEQDADGNVIRLEVGVDVTLIDGERHSIKLVPSTATDEGVGTGNVFVYEDDDAVEHFAWGTLPEVREEYLPGEPAAYWRPDRDLSTVWTLRRDLTWHHNITGKQVDASSVPRDLVKLADLTPEKEN